MAKINARRSAHRARLTDSNKVDACAMIPRLERISLCEGEER
jgi:hypothetical protein